jgi:hypothetical protein
MKFMAHATQPSSAPQSAGGDIHKDGQAEQIPPIKGELKITQDVLPGLRLMPRGLAQRIAKIALRLTSSRT